MPGLSGSDPGHSKQVGVDELTAMLLKEKDPARRVEFIDEWLNKGRGWDYKTSRRTTKKTTRPVKGPGKQPGQGPLAAGVEPDGEWLCPHCQAVTYRKYAEQHLRWHEEERERLLAVAVELLGVLGALDGR